MIFESNFWITIINYGVCMYNIKNWYILTCYFELAYSSIYSDIIYSLITALSALYNYATKQHAVLATTFLN